MTEEMIKTLEDIIEVEKRMKEKFQRLSQEADTPELRGLFQEMAQEEEGHEKELTERVIALRLMRDD
jgi:ferritin-like metal-binding protein YciE